MDSGASITAVLKLNTEPFDGNLKRVRETLTSFRNSMSRMGENSAKINGGIQTLTRSLSSLIPILSKFDQLIAQTKSFNSFTKGLLNMSEAVANLSNVTKTSQVGMLRIKEIMNAWSQSARGLTVNLRSVRAEETAEVQAQKRLEQSFRSSKQALLDMGVGVNRYSSEMLKLSQSEAQERYQTAMLQKEWGLTGQRLVEVRAKLQQMEGAVINFGKATLLTSADLEKMAMAEKQVSATSTQTSASLDKTTASANRSASAMSRASTQTSRLGKAFSSLKMMGSMVGSMLAYNFIHHLGQATNETIQSKSEMEGYFKMLHYGQTDIDKFNKALDETAHRFQRINKYSLGETISSIGVEFDLTTDEMIKAMDVTSMITSEYLRAGRNANEASLAVKDVLQGQFQRLSRETGVKGEQLKDAGWSGDNNDVEGLLDALRKVAEDRNWDVFATKANSLNDIVTIIQNRFGEWSADMVNVVQPTIVGAFNSILSFAEGLSQSLTSMWQWLNTDSWGATAVKIGTIATAILTVSQALTVYKTGMSMVQIANLGFTKTIASLVLGLKGQQIAEVGVRNSILAKIVGVKAETLAENGLSRAINERSLMLKLETVEERLNTLSSEENTTAKKYSAIQDKISTAEKEGLITAKEADTLATELNTAMTETSTIESLKQVGVNGGLTASFIALGGAKNVDAVATGELSVAMGVLNGVFYASPIGWFALAVLGLASAFYVLTGGLSDTWDKMKTFNDTMENASETTQPYRDRVEKLTQQLEDAKAKYGENSEEVAKLDKKLQDAKGTYEDLYKTIQHGEYWNEQYTESFDQLGATMDSSLRDVMKSHGFTKEQISKSGQLMDALDDSSKRQYRAFQVLKYQQDDAGKSLDSYADKLDNAGIKGDEATEKLSNYASNWQNLQYHSAIANTSDDWWEAGWNYTYAKLDQFWIDWDDFWADASANFKDGDFIGMLFGDDVSSQVGKDIKWLEDGWKYLGDTLDGWQKDAVEFLEPLNSIGDEFNKFTQDPLGYIGLQGHLDNVWKEIVEPLIKGVTEDLPNYISESLGHWGEIFDSIKKPIEDAWNNFISFDWIPSFDFDIWSLLGMDTVSASDGSSDHPSFMEDLSAILGFDVQSWIDSFTSDPLGTLGIPDPLNIMDLFGALFSLTEGDTTPIMDWFNQSLIVPISEFLMGFMLNPVAYIGNFGFTIAQFLDSILPTDFTGIWQWTMDTIITPIGDALWNGLMQIPIVGDILALLGLLSNENIGAEQKGRAIANWIGQGITNMIGQIPIVGDLLRLLGLIPQTQPTAKTEGSNMGQSIEKGVKDGIKNIASEVGQEFQDAIDAISKLKSQAEQTASDWADRVWQGVNSVLQRHSPGFIHDQFMAEFGTDIPNAIQSSGDLAYSTAQYYGQQVRDGVASATDTNLGLDSMVGEYQSDAQTISTSSEMMGTDTTTAFNSMQLAVNQSTSQMQGNVSSTYSAMQTKQTTALNTMKTQNLSAYNEMYLKSNQSLIQMRDSTTNVTNQMISAWSHMKDQIVASANKLKSDSTSHFNQLSNTIGTFYRKIQNPSNWGAGSPNYVSRARRPSAGRSAVRTIRGSRGAGLNPYTNPNKEVSLRDLMGMVSSSEKVQLQDFLALFNGGFGWNDWSPSHYSYIKTKSDDWNMKAPLILGKYQAGSGFRVGDFEGGTPTIGFDDYVATAEAIFGSVPYAFYYNSEKWGSWDNALKHGEANCSDGADALIALAHTMNPNWSTEKVHTTLKGGTGHFYAVINGKSMDTTAFQKGSGWSPLGGAGIPTRTSSPSYRPNAPSNNTEVNITINGDVYGEEDFMSKIRDGAREVMREEFNDPLSGVI